MSHSSKNKKNKILRHGMGGMCAAVRLIEARDRAAGRYYDPFAVLHQAIRIRNLGFSSVEKRGKIDS